MFKAELGRVMLAGDELVYAPPAGTNGIAHIAVADWTGKVRLDLPIGNSQIFALAVDVAAKRIALGTEDGAVQVRSLVSGEALWQASIGDRAGVVLFDGDVLRVASSNSVVGFDVTSGLEVERASIPAASALLVASDDHARVMALVVGVGLAVWASTRDELVPTAAAIAAEIAANAPLAVQSIKRTIDAFAYRGLSEALRFEALSASVEFVSEDMPAGYAAKAKKQQAEFEGK